MDQCVLAFAAANPALGTTARLEVRMVTKQPLKRVGAPNAAATTMCVRESCAVQLLLDSLSPNSRYIVRVAAINGFGMGPFGYHSRGVHTAAAAPEPPTEVELVSASESSISLRWQPPTNSGGLPILGYTLQQHRGDGQWSECASEPFGAQVAISEHDEFSETIGAEGDEEAARSGQELPHLVLTALLPGRQHWYRLATCTAYGVGPWSLAYGPFSTLSAAPSAPARPEISRGADGTAYIAWAIPDDDGGSPILDYELEHCLEGGDWARAVAGSFVGASGSSTIASSISDLYPGRRYQFRVRAVNVQGASEFSEPSLEFETALRPPSTPLQVKWASVSEHTVELKWLPPMSDGGAPVISYVVESQEHLDSEWLASSIDSLALSQTLATSGWHAHSAKAEAEWIARCSCHADLCSAVVTGLFPATTYRFRVAAHNGEAIGAPSEPSDTVTTRVSAPSAPKAPIVVEVANDAVVLLCCLPERDGGSAVESLEACMRLSVRSQHRVLLWSFVWCLCLLRWNSFRRA